SSQSRELTAKRLEVLKETIPGVMRIGVLWNASVPTSVSTPGQTALESAANDLGVQLHSEAVRTADEFEGALSSMVRAGVGALWVAPAPLFLIERVRLANVALQHRLPAIFALRDIAHAGGLMSYGADLDDLYRRAADYVDRILKGTKPGDLPIEQPTKFNLVINLNTARALGLTIPATVLARADEVIE